MPQNRKYYIQFHDHLPIQSIPAEQLSTVGKWARTSGRIYEGTSELSGKQLSVFLSETCGLPKSSFQVIPFEDGILVRR
ncbi:MAG: hypothetical protein K6A40_02545 [Solobacterium sp.]|nr:hypothetical protein [Solobacterium sp.]